MGSKSPELFSYSSEREDWPWLRLLITSRRS